MQNRPRTWRWLGGLLCAAAVLSWLCVQTTRHSHRVTPAQAAVDRLATPTLARPPGPGTPHLAKAGNGGRRETYRLSNTRQSEGQLLGNNHAILLRNALIDTRLPLKLDIPPQLRAKGRRAVTSCRPGSRWTGGSTTN